MAGGKWRFQTNGSGTVAQSATNFRPLLGAPPTLGGTLEAQQQTKLYTAFTVSLLRCNVTANNGTSAISSRFGTTNSTNVALSVTTTGWQEDATGSETNSANDLASIRFTAGGSHGNTVTALDSLLTYEHASVTAPVMGGQYSGGSFAVDRFLAIGSSIGGTATEAESKVDVKRTTAFSNLRIYLSVAGASGLVVAVGKNGASSANVTVSPTTTGAFEDTTGSESLAAGDDANIRAIRTANSWAIQTAQVTADTEAGLLGEAALTSAPAATTREYESFTGTLRNSTAADDNFTARMGSITAANLQCYATAQNGTCDVTLRVASSNSTNVTVSVTGTGYFEDVTGSDSVGDTDHLGWSLASTGTGVTIARVAVEAPWFATSSNATATGAATLPALTASGAAVQPFRATGTPTLPTITANGQAVMQPDATAAATLPSLSASGNAKQTHSATGADTLPSLSASGAAVHKQTATGTPTLPSLSASGVGEADFVATGTDTLPALSASGAAKQTQTASGTPALPALTASGSATATSENATGTGTPTLPSLSASGAAKHTQSASGADTLPTLTAASPALVKQVASASAALPSLTASAVGVMQPSATGATTLPSLTASGAAKQAQSASGTPSLPPVTASGVGNMVPVATGAVTLPALTALASGSSGFTGTGAVTLPTVLALASGYMKPSGVGAATLPPVSASGVAVMQPSGSGVMTLPALSAAGVGETEAPTSVPGASTYNPGGFTDRWRFNRRSW